MTLGGPGRATLRVCRATGNAAGFSLLELLIVLMLMAIIAAVALPIFGPGV
ncbi:MAG: prepilin-type N-terminal cleavage/methylation domain-containing protein, partial [Betaproteobacteria bacterium]